MNLEDRLRQSFSDQASRAAPSEDAWDSIERGLTGRARRRVLQPVVVAGATLTLTAAVVVGLWIAFAGRESLDRGPLGGGSSEELQSLSGRVTATLDVGDPFGLATGEDGVWVSLGGRVARIDPVSNETVSEIPVAGTGDLAVGAGSVWVAGGSEDLGPLLTRIDPDTNTVVGTVSLGRGRAASHVAADDSAVWVAVRDQENQQDAVMRIDPATERVSSEIPISEFRLPDAQSSSIGQLVVGEGAVWVLYWSFSNEDLEERGTPLLGSTLVRIDPQTTTVTGSIRLEGTRHVAVGEGGVWASVDATPEEPRFDPALLRVNPATVKPEGAAMPVDSSFAPFAAALDGIWFVHDGPGIGRISADGSRVDALVTLPGIPTGPAALDSVTRSLWIVIEREGFPIVRIDLE